MIILDFLNSCKRIPYWLYSYFILGCTHSKLSSLPFEQSPKQYTQTCMNCGTRVPTSFSIKTVKYPNRRALKLDKQISRPPRSKGVTPIRSGKSRKKVG